MFSALQCNGKCRTTDAVINLHHDSQTRINSQLLVFTFTASIFFLHISCSLDTSETCVSDTTTYTHISSTQMERKPQVNITTQQHSNNSDYGCRCCYRQFSCGCRTIKFNVLTNIKELTALLQFSSCIFPAIKKILPLKILLQVQSS